MKKLLLVTLIFLLSFIAISSNRSKNVAVVKVMRGKASMIDPSGKSVKLKKGTWLKEGATVKTGARSFVKLSFIDKSSMSVGPRSELKIEKFSKKEAGVINVLTGKIRSQVTKDYLNMDKDKSKLFIKSRNAVMGVRGTDFMFTANRKAGTSSAILFEGSVVFNRLKKGDNLGRLEDIVNKGRRIKPGQISVVNRTRKRPTVAAKINSRQFNKLNSNKSFAATDIQNTKVVKSVVPAGLNGRTVASDNNALKAELQKVVKINIKEDVNKKEDKKQLFEKSKGFVEGDEIRPADGILVHVDTGTIIPPGMDSTFDQNTNEWVSSTNGGTASNGEYAPPEGYKITDEGRIFKVDIDTGKPVGELIMEIRPPSQVRPMNEIPLKPLPKGPEPASKTGPIPTPAPLTCAEDPNCLITPPKPEDCSTCIRPDSLSSTIGAPPPPPPGRTRVIIKVNKPQ